MIIEQAKAVIQSSTIPAEIKAQVLENLEQYWNELPSYLENAIAAAIDQFDWVKTRQGDDYWDSICKRAERGEFDPPAESVEEIEASEFFRRLTSIPNYTAENIQVNIKDGWVKIGKIRVSTDDSPNQPN